MIVWTEVAFRLKMFRREKRKGKKGKRKEKFNGHLTEKNCAAQKEALKQRKSEHAGRLCGPLHCNRIHLACYQLLSAIIIFYQQA